MINKVIRSEITKQNETKDFCGITTDSEPDNNENFEQNAIIQL